MLNRVLPARPDLEQYKKQAKDLVKAQANAEPSALARIRQRHPRFRDLAEPDIQRAPFRLADAQLIIAREHDFETWPGFAAQIQTLRQTGRPAEGDARSDAASSLDLFSSRIPVDGIELDAEVGGVENAQGIVLFTQAGGNGRNQPGHRHIADELNRGFFCTVLTDLLTDDEHLANDDSGELLHDLSLLSRRVAAITDWIAQDSRFKDLELGYFASGNGAAAAMRAAAERPDRVRAVVSAAGRPDLAGPWIWRVQAPTLFIVGRKDTVALGFTNSLMAPLPHRTDRRLAVIEGAHRLFEEQDALQKTAMLARDWYRNYLTR